MAKSNPLKIVGSAKRLPEAVDIYAAWREQIASRDWSGCHISGDRREPVDLPDTRKRGWVK